MADLNSLENLSGPVTAPAPLGQAPTSGITPGIVNPGFDQVAQALTRGGGTVNQAIGSGTNQTITGGSGMDAVSGLGNLAGTSGPSSNVSGFLKPPKPVETVIADAPLTEGELDTEAFKAGTTRRQDRRSDRAARKAEGRTGAKNRRADRRARKDSWADSKI
jgi:hypothetical protein